MAYILNLIYILTSQLNNMAWPEFMQPHVDSFVNWVNGVLEYWDLEYVEVINLISYFCDGKFYSTCYGYFCQYSLPLFCQFLFYFLFMVPLYFFMYMDYVIGYVKLMHLVIGTELEQV